MLLTQTKRDKTQSNKNKNEIDLQCISTSFLLFLIILVYIVLLYAAFFAFAATKSVGRSELLNLTKSAFEFVSVIKGFTHNLTK